MSNNNNLVYKSNSNNNPVRVTNGIDTCYVIRLDDNSKEEKKNNKTKKTNNDK